MFDEKSMWYDKSYWSYREIKANVNNHTMLGDIYLKHTMCLTILLIFSIIVMIQGQKYATYYQFPVCVNSVSDHNYFPLFAVFQ